MVGDFMNCVNLVLGTMTFGESVFSPQTEEFIDAFLKLGLNEFDTAYVYNEGDSERLLGSALSNIACEYKIASKVNPRISGKLDGDAAYKQVNESLERLNLNSVDIEYLHFPDPATPVESVLEAMDELHKQGKFKELGLSNFPAWMVADVCHLCEKNGWIKPTVYQGMYNPLTRKAEIELNSCLDYFDIRFYAFNPLAGGLLTGKYVNYHDAPEDGRFTHRPNYKGRYWKKNYFDAIDIIKKSTELHNITIVEAVYRWLAYHSMLNVKRGDSIIVGASKLDHLIQNISAIQNGPLPEEVVQVFEKAWVSCKSDSPEYFTLYARKK